MGPSLSRRPATLRTAHARMLPGGPLVVAHPRPSRDVRARVRWLGRCSNRAIWCRRCCPLDVRSRHHPKPAEGERSCEERPGLFAAASRTWDVRSIYLGVRAAVEASAAFLRRSPLDDAGIRRHVEGVEEAGFHVRWLDDLLCVHAERWDGQRPPRRMSRARSNRRLTRPGALAVVEAISLTAVLVRPTRRGWAYTPPTPTRTEFCSMTTTETAINAKVHGLLQKQIAQGQQLGVQVAAYKDGERIVDAWAGTFGPGDDREVQADTLFNCFSTTKGVAATALHILADRGLIEYEQPVAKYWPEFAANGKGKITVGQAMSHQSGLHTAPPRDIILDWDRAIDYIANGTPAWEPGTATGYHAITYAWVVGGIVQGASGRHIKDVIAEEIAAPLGVSTEMYVGIPDGIEERLASLQQAPPPPADAPPSPIAALPPDHDFFKAMPVNNGVNFNDMEVRKACIPSANGHFNARSLARMYGALANGGEI